MADATYTARALESTWASFAALVERNNGRDCKIRKHRWVVTRVAEPGS
jgi:hypothetical protein